MTVFSFPNLVSVQLFVRTLLPTQTPVCPYKDTTARLSLAIMDEIASGVSKILGHVDTESVKQLTLAVVTVVVLWKLARALMAEAIPRIEVTVTPMERAHLLETSTYVCASFMNSMILFSLKWLSFVL